MDIQKRVEIILEKLNSGLVEREEHIKLALLTLISGENLVLIGPPGTAKSEISRRLAQVLKNGEYFEYLLTKFTTPEELFGPLSIEELKKDNFNRKTAGYLSSSNIAFLDEIFKANSSILNSLLTLVNEKIFHNGSKKEKSKLYSIISASNELPTNEPELEALYDRFLTRIIVDYVSDEGLEELIDADGEFEGLEEEVKFTLSELENLSNKFSEVAIPENVKKVLINIKKELDMHFKNEDVVEEIAEKVSDRRFKKSIKILKAAAYTNMREEVSILDASLLVHIFWNKPENIDIVKNIVMKNLSVIQANNAMKLEHTYRGWHDKFHNYFNLKVHEKNDKGELLYINSVGEKTTKSEEEVHKVNEEGKYVYYSPVWEEYRYLSSSKEKFSDNSSCVAVYETLNLNPSVVEVSDFETYINEGRKVSPNIKNDLEVILGNLESELKEASSITEKAEEERSLLEEQFESHVWINKKEFRKFWDEYLMKDFNRIQDVKNQFKNLRDMVSKAVELI